MASTLKSENCSNERGNYILRNCTNPFLGSTGQLEKNLLPTSSFCYWCLCFKTLGQNPALLCRWIIQAELVWKPALSFQLLSLPSWRWGEKVGKASLSSVFTTLSSRPTRAQRTLVIGLNMPVTLDSYTAQPHRHAWPSEITLNQELPQGKQTVPSNNRDFFWATCRIYNWEKDQPDGS